MRRKELCSWFFVVLAVASHSWVAWIFLTMALIAGIDDYYSERNRTEDEP